MAITTKRKFDKHVEISRNYLDGIRELEEPEKEIYSHEEPESVEGMTEKIKVDERNSQLQKGYQQTKEEGVKIENNLEKMLREAKQKFGFVYYKKIPTTCGEMGAGKLSQYTFILLDTYYKDLNKILGD